MITDKSDTKELFEAFDDTSSQLIKLASSFTEEEFNAIPFKNSWTPAQVCEHIVNSNRAITQALNAKAEKTEREPDQRVPELKELFSDFTRKFQSPEIVLPTLPIYKKETFVEDLKKSIEGAKKAAKIVNSSETIEVPGFGELTKLELMYFIIFHTKRHINQLRNILKYYR